MPLLRCTDRFAVTDVDTTAFPGPPTSYRVYWRLDPAAGWTSFDQEGAVGCGRALSIEPGFPSELCQDLPGPLYQWDHVTVATAG